MPQAGCRAVDGGQNGSRRSAAMAILCRPSATLRAGCPTRASLLPVATYPSKLSERLIRTLLYLTCSPRGPDSACRELRDVIVARIAPGRVIHRDLGAQPPQLVDAAFSAAILGPPDRRHPALAASETLIQELEAADAVVIATPMHNFTVPAVLKAWVDQVVRIHRTFASTAEGKRGLLADR